MGGFGLIAGKALKASAEAVLTPPLGCISNLDPGCRLKFTQCIHGHKCTTRIVQRPGGKDLKVLLYI